MPGCPGFTVYDPPHLHDPASFSLPLFRELNAKAGCILHRELYQNPALDKSSAVDHSAVNLTLSVSHPLYFLSLSCG
jgi:hypothetical protein